MLKSRKDLSVVAVVTGIVRIMHSNLKTSLNIVFLRLTSFIILQSILRLVTFLCLFGDSFHCKHVIDLVTSLAVQ